MPTRSAARPKRNSLNLRISSAARSLIDGAAELTGKTRTDFVLEAATRAAEEAYLERRLFAVSEAAYDAFVHRLDAPPHANLRLTKLMQTRAPWET